MGASWLIGVGVNLVGSILINLGTNVMKLGHNKRAALPLPEAAKPPISRFREWQVGVAAFTLGNAANFLSFGYAAQSLLSAIGCVQFVSNVIFASLVLKEQVTRSVLLATACIVAGCVLLVSFGDHSSATFTAHDLLALYSEPVYISYLSLSGAAVVGCYMLYHVGRRRAGWEAALPVLYSTFSALIGTQSVLFSKTLAVLLRATFDGDNQLKSWFVYLVAPCFLLTAVFWVTRLNKGLKMFPAMVIVPTLQIAWTLFSIVSGMLYFREYDDFSPLAAAMFAVGLLVRTRGREGGVW
ncbi:MAG: magnesium transporter [Monoraphidium minutum]|nr:MAG: magnesium transporter [Monoraphidium minutum]